MTLAQVLAGFTRGQQRVFALGLLLVLVVVVPLADATPADPTWLVGICDDADVDEIVRAITSATAVVNCILLRSPKLPDISARTWAKSTVLIVTAPSPTFTIRAPPAGTCIACT